MTRGREVIKRGIGNIYSWSADRIYEPFVVRRAFPILGGDLNDLVLEQGRRAVEGAGRRPLLDMPVGTAFFTLRTVQADSHHLPFADESFGAILCTNGLQVIPGLEESLAELARVLAPGAYLYVSIITMPLAAALPAGAGRRLPTVLKSRRELIDAMTGGGLALRSVRSQRFATLIEALKPLARTDVPVPANSAGS